MSTSRPMRDGANDRHNSEEASSPLSSLPNDVRQVELYSRSPLSVLGFLAQTSHHYERDTAFLRLLASALNAEPESYQSPDETRLAAMAILKRHPELLFKRGQVKDHVGRTINASPYQLFLGAGDIWALKQVHAVIVPHIENGEAIARAQFQAQFPHCPQTLGPDLSEAVFYDDRNKAQVAQVRAQLKIIVEKITADPCTDGLATCEETTKAVLDLCNIFKPKEGETIKTGLHFPLSIMQEIVKVYETQFDLWSGAKCAFFALAVVGAASAASTAVDGQCFKYGLGNLNLEKGPDRRDGLFCRRPKGIPQTLAPLTGKLGRTMFVDPYDGHACFWPVKAGCFDWYYKNGAVSSYRCGIAATGSVTIVWLTYVEQKRHAYSTYAATPRTENDRVRDLLK